MDDQLTALSDATDNAVAASEARLRALREFVVTVRHAVEHLNALSAQQAEAARTRDRLDADQASLTAVRRPADLDQLEEARGSADAALTTANHTLTAAEEADSAARAAQAEAPARGPLELAVRHHRELSALTAKLPSLVDAHNTAIHALTGAHQARVAAVAAVQSARTGREQAGAAAEAAHQMLDTLDRETALLRAVRSLRTQPTSRQLCALRTRP